MPLAAGLAFVYGAHMTATLCLSVLALFAPLQHGGVPTRPEPVPAERTLPAPVVHDGPNVMPQPLDVVDEPIAAGELFSHVSFLASDELRGRYTGTAEGVLAAEYLAAQLGRLKAAGLLPAGDVLSDGQRSFLQDVHLPGISFERLPSLSVRGAEPLPYGTDFELRSGFGLSGELELIRVSDLAELPDNPRSDGALYLDMFASKARRAIRERGDDWKRGWGAILYRGSKSPGRAVTDPRRLVRVRGPERPLEIDVNGPGRAALEAHATGPLTLDVGGKPKRAYNVVARLPANTELPEGATRETVVISAHYDHLRPREVPEGEDGIFNGADDDASGVAAVLEITEAMCLSDKPRDRDVVVLLATGEEIGLVGTTYYLDHPVAPLATTSANLNFEMLGRADALAGGTGKLWLTGFEHTNLGPTLAAEGIPVVEDPRPEQHFFERSDNYAFVLKGVVGQSLSSYNLHTDYHHASDETETIEFEHLMRGTRVGLAALRKLVDGDFRVAWSPDYSLPIR